MPLIEEGQEPTVRRKKGGLAFLGVVLALLLTSGGALLYAWRATKPIELGRYTIVGPACRDCTLVWYGSPTGTVTGPVTVSHANSAVRMWNLSGSVFSAHVVGGRIYDVWTYGPYISPGNASTSPLQALSGTGALTRLGPFIIVRR
jgi:hypothetical protein